MRERKCFNEDFLNYLANFKFTGDIWAVPEGTPIFPGSRSSPSARLPFQAQLVETYLLLCVNHQSLIATKANRVVRAAEDAPCWNSVPAGRRARTPLSWAREPRISAAAMARPAPFLTSSTASTRAAPWPRMGADV